MRRSWTLVGIGATAELLALALWAFAWAHEFLFWPFVSLSLLAGLAGAWIVLATMFDLTFHRPETASAAVRGFDLVGARAVLLACCSCATPGQLPPERLRTPSGWVKGSVRFEKRRAMRAAIALSLLVALPGAAAAEQSREGRVD